MLTLLLRKEYPHLFALTSTARVYFSHRRYYAHTTHAATRTPHTATHTYYTTSRTPHTLLLTNHAYYYSHTTGRDLAEMGNGERRGGGCAAVRGINAGRDERGAPATLSSHTATHTPHTTHNATNTPHALLLTHHIHCYSLLRTHHTHYYTRSRT